MKHDLISRPFCCFVLIILALPGLVAAEAGFKPVAIDLKGADAHQVFAVFGKMLDAEVESDPAIDAAVSLRFDSASWPVALDALCESLSCQWSLTGGQPRRLLFTAVETFPSGDPLETRISLDLEHADGGELFGVLGSVLGTESTVDAPLDDSGISLRVENVTLRTALRLACEHLACRWQIEEGRILVTQRESDAGASKPSSADAAWQALAKPIDIALKAAPAQQVLRTFGHILGLEVSMGAGIEGAVSLDLQSVAARDGLDEACLQAGCSWDVRESGDGLELVFESVQ